MIKEPVWQQRKKQIKGKEHTFTWWVIIAVLLALIAHVVLLILSDRVSLFTILDRPEPLKTRPLQVMGVMEVPDEVPENLEVDHVPEPSADLLLDDIEDAFPALKDLELDISPKVKQPELALQMKRPAIEGEKLSRILEATKGPQLKAPDLSDLGVSQRHFKEAAAGQLVVDAGASVADLLDPLDLSAHGLKGGGGGLTEEGVREGYRSLDSLIGLSPEILNASKSMIGSDLLFAYNQAVLKDAARLTLMKVAMLIEMNPRMYCWVEGHADLIGGTDYNDQLSEKRAAAVQAYLVETLRLPEKRIIAMGLGQSEPLVLEGSAEEQALNRRVEIKMRKEKPALKPLIQKAESTPEILEEEVPPRAEPVEEDTPPKAELVE